MTIYLITDAIGQTIERLPDGTTLADAREAARGYAATGEYNGVWVCPSVENEDGELDGVGAEEISAGR